MSIVLVFLVAVGFRFSFALPGAWQQPWTPHHFDEHFLPQEALALWEGVSPREIGWPASTFRLALAGAYSVPLAADTHPALAAAPDAATAMGVIARWIGERTSDSEGLYKIARSMSAIIGVLHVLIAMLAARRWLGAASMPIAGALVAVAPVAVSHSQLVLADVLGVCFATAILALSPDVADKPRSASWLGILAGLATASKFHFGIWLLFSLGAIWLTGRNNPTISWRVRAISTLLTLLTFGLTLLAFVPWFWTNPILALKEFAAVVLSKAGDGPGALSRMLSNAFTVTGVLGPAIVVGAIAGAAPLVRQWRMLGVSVIGFTIATLLLLSGSAIVFGRHGLLLLPGLALAATAGWQSASARWPRFSPSWVTALVLVVGVPFSVRATNEFRFANSYHTAHNWIRTHLPDGASVVIYSEDNQFLPRTATQLDQCAAYVWTDAAYREKWRTNGMAVPANSGMPMQSAVMADEIFHSYWCARERLAVSSPAFVVHRFHPDPRFQTMTVPALRDEFVAGLADASRGFDAVLVHWNLFPQLQPSATFMNGSGPELRLYLRPTLSLRR